MQIDGAAVSLDTILHMVEIVAIVGGGFGVAYRIGKTHSAIAAAIENQGAESMRQGRDIADLKTEIKKQNDILTKIAVQDERLANHEKWIDELRHGEGMVIPLRKGAYERARKSPEGGQKST